MSEDQINHMIIRFLRWKLPEDFSPDAGISFKASYNENTQHPFKHEPTGTNLFNWAQAEAMVRYMIAPAGAVNDDIKNRLLELENDDALPDYATQSFQEAATEIERLREALKMEQEKFQLETLRTSGCAALLRRWMTMATSGSSESGSSDTIWGLVKASDKLPSTPSNILQPAKEPKP